MYVAFDGFIRKYDIIPGLMEVAQNAVKEKVIRVVVATFRVCCRMCFLLMTERSYVYYQNLVTNAPTANLPAMLVCQLLPYVKNLAGRKWSDEDILEDVQFLKDELNNRFQSLTYVRVTFLTNN